MENENQNIDKEFVKSKIEKLKQMMEFFDKHIEYDKEKHEAIINLMEFENIIDNIPISEHLSYRYQKIFFYDITVDLKEILDNMDNEQINKFNNLEDLEEYLIEKINEYADQDIEIYYSELLQFLCENIDLFDYLDDQYQIYDFLTTYTDRKEYNIGIWELIQNAQYWARYEFYTQYIHALLYP